MQAAPVHTTEIKQDELAYYAGFWTTAQRRLIEDAILTAERQGAHAARVLGKPWICIRQSGGRVTYMAHRARGQCGVLVAATVEELAHHIAERACQEDMPAA